MVAVGTTATRALETVVGPDGRVHAGSGWTERLVTRDDPRVVDGLVTGWHDPEASHLMLVESVAGPELTRAAYGAAMADGYLCSPSSGTRPSCYLGGLRPAARGPLHRRLPWDLDGGCGGGQVGSRHGRPR